MSKPLKIQLNKNNEAVAEAEAKRQREIEADIQEHDRLQQEKIIQLHKKQKVSKIICIVAFILFVLILVVYGTYDRFFKKSVTMDDVKYYAYAYSLEFPEINLEGYLRNNINGMFDTYVITSNSEFSKKYSDIEVDKNSLSIIRVNEISLSSVQVWFTADVIVTEKDTEVTDEKTLERLRKNGLGVVTPTPEPTPTPTPEPTPTPVPTEPSETVADPNADANVVTANATLGSTRSYEVVLLGARRDEGDPVETTIEGDPTEPTENVDNDKAVSMELQNSDGTITEYYITAGGKIMQKGKTITQRYTFYIPIDIFNETDAEGKETGVKGMKPGGALTIYSFVDIDVTDFSTIKPNSYWTWTAEQVDVNTKNSAQIKVDKVLSDLYSGRDTSQDFFNNQVFDTHGATYEGISRFEMYSGANAMGYNAYVEYTITLPQGFSYTLHNYLVVQKDGNSWIITALT